MRLLLQLKSFGVARVGSVLYLFSSLDKVVQNIIVVSFLKEYDNQHLHCQ